MAIRESNHYDTVPHQMYGWGNGAPVRLGVDSFGSLLRGISIPPHDAINFTWTSGNVTGVQFISNTVLVATLTLTYSNGNISSVVKS